MEFISTRKGNSMFDEMKSRVFEQKTYEEMKAHDNLADGELEEYLDVIESDYVFNLAKVDELADLSTRSEEIQRRFIEQKFYIEEKNISEKAKIQTILTTASILNRVDTRPQDLRLEELYLLSAAMIQMPFENYPVYGDVLSHPILLSSILLKSDDINEQLDMCSQIVGYCDTFTSQTMNDAVYQKAIKDSLNLISKYQTKEKEHIR